MKEKKFKIHFKFYVIILFFCCILLYNFSRGFYEGFVYGDKEITQTEEVGRDESRDNWADFLIRVGVAVVLCIVLHHELGKPISDLNVKMSKIAGGDLDSRVEESKFKEFEQIGNSFNAMAEALRAAEQEKKQQEKNNQQLYSNIAHDLKSPMTMVLGYARALERGDVPEDKKEQYLHTICEQTEHVNELLDVLLAYTRLENQSYQLKLENKDLAEVLRSCVAGYYDAFEEHGSHLEIDIPEEECKYCFDEIEMRRAFNNLLTNMIRHTEQGTACKVEMNVIYGSKKESHIRISFIDEGEGLSEELKENLFKPFSVGDVSRNTKGGSGLGLSIAKKVAERHGGRLEYEECVGQKGKAFVIELK